MKEKTVVIIQPSFFPWRGYIDLLAQADTVILLDNVQWIKRHWFNRNKVELNGKAQWITVPVQTKGRALKKINEIEISYESNWQRKMLQTIEHAYKKTPYFNNLFPDIDRLINLRWKNISDISEASLHLYFKHFNLPTTPLKASELQINSSNPVDRLIKLCKSVKGTKYLSPPAAKAYIKDKLPFHENNISLQWMKYEYPNYEKNIKDPLTELSAIDLLFKFGPEASKYIWPKNT